MITWILKILAAYIGLGFMGSGILSLMRGVKHKKAWELVKGIVGSGLAFALTYYICNYTIPGLNL